MMSTILIALLLNTVEPQDFGGCYSTKPMCWVGHPRCMCSIALDCHWVCW
jgi:hypothetical protein